MKLTATVRLIATYFALLLVIVILSDIFGNTFWSPGGTSWSISTTIALIGAIWVAELITAILMPLVILVMFRKSKVKHFLPWMFLASVAALTIAYYIGKNTGHCEVYAEFGSCQSLSNYTALASVIGNRVGLENVFSIGSNLKELLIMQIPLFAGLTGGYVVLLLQNRHLRIK